MKPEDIDICRGLAQAYILRHGGGAVESTLGHGGSAVVFMWSKGGTTTALKVYDPKFLAGNSAPAERYRLNLQRNLIGHQCPFLIGTLAVDEEDGTCFVQMEYFRGVELKKAVSKVPDAAIGQVIQKLAAAAEYLDSRGLVHRDIKPENIVVSEDFEDLRLLDLGVVRENSTFEDRPDATDHGQRRPFIATAQYSSPEYLFRLEPPSRELWKGLTIYQLGGVLHDLVCKRSLFENSVAADNKYALAMSVMREIPDFSAVPAHLSHWAAVAAKCLTKDGSVRLQLVDWKEFQQPAEPAQDRLKRMLTGRTISAARGEANVIYAQTLGRRRSTSLDAFVEEMRGLTCPLQPYHQ